MTTPEPVKPAPEKKPGTAVALTEPLGPEPEVAEDELVAVATTFDEKQLAFRLSSTVRQSAMIRRAAAAIGEVGWGKNINPVQRAAVARYALELGCDPTRHVYVLGGGVYLNAEFYRELCAANPDFQADDVDFIHDDPRADEAEKARRAALRVKWGVPENAPGAALVTLHYKGKGPFYGVNWAGVRKNDPVGTEEPVKTAHTRAYRKAAMKAETAWFRLHPKLKPVAEIVAEPRETEVQIERASDEQG